MNNVLIHLHPHVSTIKVTFITPEGEAVECKGHKNDSLLDVAHANDVELEGACEGSLACSTCHVILDSDVYDALEEPSDEENDMLDLAFGLTETYVDVMGLDRRA